MTNSGFNNIDILLISICTALNLVIGSIVFILKLPIYLDMIGTLLCAFMYWENKNKAFIYASITGVVSFILGGIIINPFLPWFILTVIGVSALTAYVTSPILLKNSSENFGTTKIFRLALSGILTGVLAAVLSAPIVVYLFGGVTGSGSALLVSFFMKTGSQLMEAAFLSGFTAEPVDKTLQVIIALSLYRVTPRSILGKLT